jgi:hypothetical protein
MLVCLKREDFVVVNYGDGRWSSWLAGEEKEGENES